ncbi:RidA family protein [Motiliproteus sediminis]|uniref:RidA family protein n=1 Tax=Motiliproteus sediminis TaxID=1468178 RepID=UPI001AEFC887|nr:RidA family protein [Motiliproteus sediminis]
MSIDRYQTSARMSKIVVHNHTVYLCGQVAEDRSADITEQTRTMLAKVDQLLAEVGSGRDKLLSATLYLKSMDDFTAMNAVWDAWVPEGHAPARACVEAAMASPELKVEISVIAAC